MAERGFTTVGTRRIADLGFINITMRDVQTPAGEVVERVVIEHPGAAAVVPLVDGDVVLIEQYRSPLDERLLEIPAGKIDDGNTDPAVTAARELEEETGFRCSDLTHVVDIYPSVGMSDEVIAIYVASDLVPGTRMPVGAEEVDATIVRMPFSEAVEAVLDGRIKDAKTAIGLLAVAHRGSP